MHGRPFLVITLFTLPPTHIACVCSCKINETFSACNVILMSQKCCTTINEYLMYLNETKCFLPEHHLLVLRTTLWQTGSPQNLLGEPMEGREAVLGRTFGWGFLPRDPLCHPWPTPSGWSQSLWCWLWSHCSLPEVSLNGQSYPAGLTAGPMKGGRKRCNRWTSKICKLQQFGLSLHRIGNDHLIYSW